MSALNVYSKDDKTKRQKIQTIPQYHTFFNKFRNKQYWNSNLKFFKHIKCSV